MEIPDAVRTLERDLRSIFGNRLQSLVAYRNAGAASDAPAPTLAVVDSLSVDDLRSCADRVSSWHESGLGTPLLLRPEEFGRSLDAFPYEFGGILADHDVVSGANPFEGLTVDVADLRRACEIQARGHLLHLREGYIETQGRSDALAELIVRSSGALAALMQSVSRLSSGDVGTTAGAAARHVETLAGLTPGSLSDVVTLSTGAPLSGERARQIFPVYLEAINTLTNVIDRWNR